jgi:hypothetical protein
MSLLVRLTTASLAVCLACLAGVSEAFAQPAASAEGRGFVLEASAGHAEFADSPPVPHSVFSAGGRVYLSRRLALGPELTVMRGSGIDRDTFLTANATFDLLVPPPARPVQVVPYLIGGLGFVSMTTQVGTGPYSSSEGTFTTGAGVRVASRQGWFVAPEVRIGWELHWRAGVQVGFRRQR